jgi:hypothetical protein
MDQGLPECSVEGEVEKAGAVGEWRSRHWPWDAVEIAVGRLGCRGGRAGGVRRISFHRSWR